MGTAERRPSSLQQLIAMRERGACCDDSDALAVWRCHRPVASPALWEIKCLG